ncbi:MAG: hypothetical protein EA409_05800 [Saprospirales bacterium]|nr:MAG: hypothetical protein EA409_05800 [Saprospirales bacterium]
MNTPYFNYIWWILIFGLFVASITSCYSFKGTSIDPNVNTFFIGDFEITAPNAPITISQDFSEALRDKIRLETRLTLADIDPDIEFTGSIVTYNVTALDPQPGEFTALNRLQIGVRIEYLNNKKKDDKWQQTFSFFEDFPADQNLIDVEENLISIIFDQLTEDIFNRAFSDW